MNISAVARGNRLASGRVFGCKSETPLRPHDLCFIPGAFRLDHTRPTSKRFAKRNGCLELPPFPLPSSLPQQAASMQFWVLELPQGTRPNCIVISRTRWASESACLVAVLPILAESIDPVICYGQELALGSTRWCASDSLSTEMRALTPTAGREIPLVDSEDPHGHRWSRDQPPFTPKPPHKNLPMRHQIAVERKSTRSLRNTAPISMICDMP